MATKNPKKTSRAKGGRPSTYTPKLADSICAQIAEGTSLRTICRDEKMPAASTVFLWLREHTEFSEQYARAKDECADALAEEIQELADKAPTVIVGDDRSDSARVAAIKLQIDTKKWLASKLKPKKYSEKIDVTSGGDKLPPAPYVYLPQDLPRDIVPDEPPQGNI